MNGLFNFLLSKFQTFHSFKDGTTHVVWAYGRGPLYSLAGLDINDQANSVNGKRCPFELLWLLCLKPTCRTLLGFQRMRLWQVDPGIVEPADTKTYEVRHQVDLPSDDTTYWCSTHQVWSLFLPAVPKVTLAWIKDSDKMRLRYWPYLINRTATLASET